MKNVIQTKLTEKDKSQVDELIVQLETLLKGKLSALTEKERKKYGSINEQNKLFVNKVRGYVQTTPTLCAPEIDWEDFKKDYDARLFLESRTERLQSLAFQMESTKMMHDYDNFRDALTDYNYAQYKKGAGENGYTEKVAELKQFFVYNRKNGDKSVE